LSPRLNAAFYAAPVEEFLAASDEEAYAPLAAPKGYTLAPEQLSAWHLQLPVLRAALADLPAGLGLEKGDAALFLGWLFASDRVPGKELRPLFPLFSPWIHLEFDIPPGAKRDKTRSPGFYEGVSQYLTDLGVPQV
jgi:hypothetical protein